MRVAVITPHYNETSAVLARCINSVQQQTYTDWQHFVMGDGKGVEALPAHWWLIPKLTYHSLPWTGDSGNTPRLVAFALANKQGFDAVVFLDGDNWMDPEHLANMVALQQSRKSDIVTCPRRLLRSDNLEVLAAEDTIDSDGKRFNDMNCYFITRPAFFVLHAFLLEPQEFGVLSDHYLWDAIVKEYNSFYIPRCVQPTINYVTTYTWHYILYKQPAPPNSKAFVQGEQGIVLQPCNVEDFIQLLL